jgi:hypothetical protein
MNTNNNVENNHKSLEISNLIQYAHSNYEENPTEALGALMQALQLNSGKASAERAMEQLRQHNYELQQQQQAAPEDHPTTTANMQRAFRGIIDDMLQDESTFLFQRGKQDILRQAMQDGSSVVCTKCLDIVSASRWQQHQQYWCTSTTSSTSTDMKDCEDDDDEEDARMMQEE